MAQPFEQHLNWSLQLKSLEHPFVSAIQNFGTDRNGQFPGLVLSDDARKLVKGYENRVTVMADEEREGKVESGYCKGYLSVWHVHLFIY